MHSTFKSKNQGLLRPILPWYFGSKHTGTPNLQHTTKQQPDDYTNHWKTTPTNKAAVRNVIIM